MRTPGLFLIVLILLASPVGATETLEGPASGVQTDAVAARLPDWPAEDAEALPSHTDMGAGLSVSVPGEAAIGAALQREIDRGKASYYGKRFHGRRTASGERFNMYALTAAHPSLPFGTRLRVRHLESGREVVVRINDRGPHVGGRILDLSQAAAEALGMLQAGESRVALVQD